jgi:hypothetical protein
MNNFSDADYEQMDRFLNNTLTEAEQQAFLKRLHVDADLAAEVEWLRSLYANYRFLHQKQQVQKLHNELAQEGLLATEPTTVVLPLWQRPWVRPLLAAASVSIVLGAGVWFWQAGSGTPDTPPVAVESPPTTTTATTPPNELPDADPAENDPTALARAFAQDAPLDLNNVPPPLRDGVAAYENGNLDRAISQLNKPVRSAQKPTDEPTFGSGQGQVSKPEPANIRQYRLLYLGLSYLKNNQPKRALAALQQVKQTDLQPTANWYEALCQIQLGQSNEAIRVLKAITDNPDHPYFTEARPLLDALTTN